MSLNKLFEVVEQARETANWGAAFGEPKSVGDRTVMPVAQVGYWGGLGFGSGTAPADEEDKPASTGEGGGSGGGALARPLGVIVVTPENVYFEEVRDNTKVTILGVGIAALAIWQIAKTLRVIFGQG
jgi:uncharacterized spore protein YtfJ